MYYKKPKVLEYYAPLVLLPIGGFNFLCCVPQSWLCKLLSKKLNTERRVEKTLCHFPADTVIASACFDNFFLPSTIVATNVQVAADILFWIPE